VKMGLGSGISTVKLGLLNLDNNSFNNYHFLNITPQAQVNYSPKQQTNFSISYRGTTRQPTINQLQPIRDNTDPLVEYVGNPDLKVGFNHNINLNFNQYKVLKQVYSFAYFGYNIQQHAITQFNTIDPVTGKRTYYPVNINGNTNWNFGSNWNKGGGMMKATDKKPHYGFNMNANGGKYINFINGQKAVTRSFSINFGPSIGMEAEDKFDINFNPYLGYNSSVSSLSSSVNNNYFTYGVRSNAEVDLPGGLEAASDIEADLREPAAERHLTALEEQLVEVAGLTSLLALLSAASGLAEARARAATLALLGLGRPLGGRQAREDRNVLFSHRIPPP